MRETSLKGKRCGLKVGDVVTMIHDFNGLIHRRGKLLGFSNEKGFPIVEVETGGTVLAKTCKKAGAAQ